MRRAVRSSAAAATAPVRLAASLVGAPAPAAEEADQVTEAEPATAEPAPGRNGRAAEPTLLDPDSLIDLDTLVGLVGGGASIFEDAVEEGVDLIEDAIGAHRRIWEDEEHRHAQIEVRGIEDPAAVGLRHRIARALARSEGVRWAEVNAITGRVAVAFDGGEPALAGLVELLEGLEEVHGARRETSRASWDVGDRAEHPADLEPIHRVVAIMVGDALSLGWAVAGRVAHAARVPVELAGLVTVVDNNPWLRLQAERVLGQRVAALVLPLASAAASGVAQGPFGVLVDLAYQGTVLGELRARRDVWERREPEFYAEQPDEPVDPPDIGPRPEPVAEGPVERWSRRSAQVALAGVGAAGAATRDPRRSTDLFLAATPKAARLGREGFAAHLGRVLAYRGIVPLDASALRRLDRVDTVVLDAEVLVRERRQVRRVVAPDGKPVESEVAEAAARLLDPDAPGRVRSRRPWRLEPFASAVAAGSDRLPRGAKTRAREIARGDGDALALSRAGEMVAIVDVGAELAGGAQAVVDEVRRCGHRLVIAGGDGAGWLGDLLDADDVIRGGGAMGDDVRSLQANGAVVLVIGRQGHRGLAAADVGLGVVTPTGRPSWGADLILGRDLADAATVVAATRVAAQVSERAVRFAMAGSAFGTLVTLTGPRNSAGSRGLAMVNGAAAAALVAGTWAAVRLSHEPRPPLSDPVPWHELTADDAVEGLGTDVARGLTSGDVSQRRSVTGAAAREVAPSEPFLAELANPMNPVLAAGAGLSAATGSMTDAWLVTSLIGVNTAIGGIQRLRADRTVREQLQTDVVPVLVRRDRKERELAPEELVRGDVLILRAGDVVPADARVVTAQGCEVDESSLTGESLPVAKTPEPSPASEVASRTCMLYQGTTVAAGSTEAVVVATGRYTEVARSLALAGPPPPSGVEQRLEELTRRLLPGALGAAAGTAGVGLLRRWPLRDVSGTAVSLAVASVPEGLPFVATAGQLAGARRLAAHGALVRNPRTVEALGRVDVLCVDKTGTLTEGRVELVAVSDGVEVAPLGELNGTARGVLAAALRASDDPHEVAGRDLDDTDAALYRAAARSGVGPDEGIAGWEPVGDLPFDASRGVHAVLGSTRDGHRLVVKGAPEAILDACTIWCRDGERVPFDADARAEVLEHVGSLAARGHRLIAVAERHASSRPEVAENRLERLELHGLVVLADPVRPTAAEAVRGIAEAGVRTVMVTGDHPETAVSIAHELELNGGDVVLTGPEIDRLDDDELGELLDRTSVVARVTPAHKLRVVQALQARGRVVAMTGDGANDAAAIRLAEVGVALGARSSSAAREAADIVVTDDRIETLIDAIAEGRALWGSIREALAVLVGGNLGEIGFTSVASMFSSRAPLHPRQFLLVNLLTDLAPAVAIAVRPPLDVSTETLLREGPEASLGHQLRRDVAIRGTATALGASAAWTAARLTGTRRHAGTVGLAALVGTQLGQTVVAGGWRRPTTLATALGSAAVLVGVVQTPGLNTFFGCRPLGPVGWTQASVAALGATAGSQIASSIARATDRLDPSADGRGVEPYEDVTPRSTRRPRPAPTGDAVLVTGATGCIGSALVPRLLAEGRHVRCLVRDPDRLDPAWRDRVEVVVGSVEDRATVEQAGRGCSLAYYLVHGLDGPLDTLADRERRAAAAFRGAVERGGIARIVYLGGLVDEDDLARTSEHLFARQQVGEELRDGAVEVTELRAGIVLAPGSASVALLLAAARSPMQVWGAWASSKVQPIALSDLLDVLVRCVDDPRTAGAVLDIGGPEVLTYEELVEQVRSAAGQRPGRRVRLPYLPVEAAAPLAASRAGLDAGLTLSLLQSVRSDAIVRDQRASALFPGVMATGSRAALADMFAAAA